MATLPAMSADGSPQAGRSWKDRLFWPVVTGLAVGGTLLAIQAILRSKEPDPIPQQLDRLTQEFEAGSSTVLDLRPANFHGSGVSSYVFIIRDERLSGVEDPGSRRSDEVRIYDEIDGSLELAFRFRPELATPDTSWVVGEPIPYAFVLRSLQDLDRDGRDELVGGYGVWTMAPTLPTPIAITWEGGRYRMQALVPSSPDIAKPPSPGAFGRTWLPNYESPSLLVDPEEDETLRGFPVEDFAAYRAEGDVPIGGVRLVAAFLVRATSHADPELYDLEAWTVDLKGQTYSYQCGRPPQKAPFRIKAGDPSLADSLATRWQQQGWC